MRLVLLFITVFSVGFLGIYHFEFKRLRKENSQLNEDLLNIKNENFINQTNATRYEIALDRLMEADSICGKKYDEMLSNIE